MVKLKYHGHSCWEISSDGHSVVIDPFFTHNPSADAKATDIKSQWVIVTHGHDDHWGDTPTIIKQNNGTLITVFEIAEWAEKQGINSHGLHIGGSAKFSFGWVKLTIAHHGSILPDGSYGGNPAGVLLNIGGKTIYHAGDTGLFLDMKLIGEMNPIDLALLPIGDNYTMGPVDASKAVEFLRPKKVVPMHYDTFGPIKQDPEVFAKMVKAHNIDCEIVKPGGTVEI